MRVAHTTIADKLGANAEAIKRWERKATRALNALVKLRKQRARLERLIGKGRLGAAAVETILQELNECATESSKPTAAITSSSTAVPSASGEAAPKPPLASPSKDAAPPDDLAIPSYLRRERSPADQAAIDRAKAEREERQKAKAKGQAEKRKAQRLGETKRMPLTGKAALEAIRGN